MNDNLFLNDNITEIKTDEQPIRYVAHANPNTWVELKDISLEDTSAGCELATIHMPVQNIDKPYIDDGIYIDVDNYRNDKFLIDCIYLEPTFSRRQHRYTNKYDTFEEAKKTALEWLNGVIDYHNKLMRRYELSLDRANDMIL